MKKQPPLIIHLPLVSDKAAVDIYNCLEALVDAFASNYAPQLRRYYDRHPQQQRPARFDGEPF